MTQPDESSPTPTRLFNKNFTLLWTGQSISILGKQMFAIAMLFWVKHETNSATLVGLLQMISSFPAVILGPIGGAVADRYSRRSILIFCDLFLGIVVLSLALGVFVFPQDTQFTIIWLFVVSLLISILDAFFTPSISAAVPDLVPDEKIATANSLSQISYQIGLFVGQGVGGTLFRILGAPVLFLINGLAYLIAGFSETFITIPQVIPEKSIDWKKQLADIKNDMLDGFRFIWKETGLKNLVILSALKNFFSVPIIVLLAFYVEDTLKAAVDWYSFLITSYSVGMLIGYILVGAIPIAGKKRRNIVLTFIILESIGYGLLGINRSVYAALAMTFVGGLVSGFTTITITTIVQIVTPGEIRGRVFGLLATIAGSIAPLAMGLTGVIADLLNQNIPVVYIGCGVLMTISTTILALNPALRKFLEADHENANPSQVAPVKGTAA